jgi:transcriptional regulator with GAF, ATPase, and Fis domain
VKTPVKNSPPPRKLRRLPIDSPLGERLEFERVVADVAARFVNIPVEQVDEAIVDAQRRIVQTLGIDRSTLWQFMPDGDLVYTHVWARPEFAPPPDHVSARAEFPWTMSKLQANQAVWIESLSDNPDPIDRASSVRVGTRSTAVIPVTRDGAVVGAISFGAMRSERRWPPAIRERLKLIAAVFAQALARRDYEVKLRKALAEVQTLRDQLATENAQLRNEVRTVRPNRAVAAESRAMRRILEQIEPVARTPATVLLLGETGSGKEVLAQAIHEASDRGGRPMVRVNCAAIPTALIESELFGRERGAYTGALSRQIGRFELAEGSTLFLDEVGDLPLEAQAKLLRVLQDKVVERLGGSRAIRVDVRIIAATNRDLSRAVADRTFREDLYYRLNVFPITVPPLRERREDIPVLVWDFIDEFSKAFGRKIDTVSKSDLAGLQAHAWPGNVRELRNVIERAVIVATGSRLAIELPNPVPARPERAALRDVEADHILEVLNRAGWRIRGAGGAAERLAMKPTTLESRMAKLGIRRPRA